MKKIKKENFRLEKEVITQLSQDHLDQMKGGVHTFGDRTCNSNEPNCYVIGDSKVAGGCGSEQLPCKPIYPESVDNPPCLVSKNCGESLLCPFTQKNCTPRL